jgi:hypothetical protein
VKTCKRCKQEKPFDAFGNAKCRKDGLDWHCRQCKAELYQKLDKKKRSEWRRNHYLQNQERELAVCEKYREINRDKRNDYIRLYYKQYPAKGAAKTAKYRYTKLKATPIWITKEQLKEIEKIYESCPKGHEVDHIIPIQGKQVRGLHVPWNLQYLPSRLNKRKGNRIIPHECLAPQQ